MFFRNKKYTTHSGSSCNYSITKNIRRINNRSNFCNASSQNHPGIGVTTCSSRHSIAQQSQGNVWRHTDSKKQLQQISLNNLSTQLRKNIINDSKDKHRSSSEIKQNLSRAPNTKIPNPWSDRKGKTLDLWHKSNENRHKRYFGCGCCQYSYLCIFMSLCSALLFATSIAAILVGLLTRTSKSSTTTIQTLILLTGTNESVYGLWNTTAGSDSILATPGSANGNYNPIETPQNVFDQNCTTKYNSYGLCNSSSLNSLQCGINTGLYLTLQRGASLLISIRFCTGNNLQSRDPMTITLEGSNQLSSTLLLGSSWTLIYNGSSGLVTDPGRSSFGMTEIIPNNVVWYNSYRLL